MAFRPLWFTAIAILPFAEVCAAVRREKNDCLHASGEVGDTLDLSPNPLRTPLTKSFTMWHTRG